MKEAGETALSWEDFLRTVTIGNRIEDPDLIYAGGELSIERTGR
jgi:hypothetical protein